MSIGLVFGPLILLAGLVLGLAGRLVGTSAYRLADRLIALLIGLMLLVGVLVVLGHSPAVWDNGTLFLLLGGLIILRSELKGGLGRITPAEALRWSWRGARRYSIIGLLIGLAFGIVLELIAWMRVKVEFGLASGLFLLVMASSPGLIFGVIGSLIGGLTAGQIAIRTIPNEGIRRSLRNALISFLTVGLVFGLFVELGRELNQTQVLLVGLFTGQVAGLVFGGSAFLKHYILRFLLRRNDYAPLNYVRFLEYAAERVFLRKVGGGYVFTHRLLMEYFAALQPIDQARHTQTA